MDCGEARKAIYLSSGIRIITTEVIQAQKHIKRCAECSEFFQSEENIQNLIMKRAPKVKAPHSLREKILADMAESSSSNRFYNLLPFGRIGLSNSLGLLGIFVILVVSTFTYYLLFNRDSHSLASQLAKDHLRNIPEQVQILSSEPRKIEDWFRGKVDFAVLVPELRGARLKGGRLCHIENSRVALLFYEKDGIPISLFVMDDSTASLSPKGRLEIYDKKLHKQSERGCNLIFWRNGGITYALVSDIDREELSQLVPEVALKD